MEIILYIAAIVTIIGAIISIPKVIIGYNEYLLKKPELRAIEPKTFYNGFDIEVKNNSDKQIEILNWKIAKKKFLFIYSRDLDVTDTDDMYDDYYYIKPYKSKPFEIFIDKLYPLKEYKITVYTTLGRCMDYTTADSTKVRVKKRLKVAAFWGAVAYGIKTLFDN